MHLLKLKLIHTGNQNYFYTVYYSSFTELNLLLDCFRDFAHPSRFPLIKHFLENREQSLTGDLISLDKIDDKNLSISFLYADESSSLIIPIKSLKETLEMFYQMRNIHPEEIIIKFDDTMQNPTVEAIGNLFSSLDK